MNKKELKKEYEKKDCLDCHFNNCGVCDALGAITKPTLIHHCKYGELRIKGN